MVGTDDAGKVKNPTDLTLVLQDDNASAQQDIPEGVVATALQSLPLEEGTVVSPTLRSPSGPDAAQSICGGGLSTNSCGLQVKDAQPGVQCDICSQWFHNSCQSVSKAAYNALRRHSSVAFICSSCRLGIGAGSGQFHGDTGGMAGHDGSLPGSSLGRERGMEIAVERSIKPALLEQATQVDMGSLEREDSALHNNLMKRIEQLDTCVREHMAMVMRMLEAHREMNQAHADVISRTVREGSLQKVSYAEALKTTCQKMVSEIGKQCSNAVEKAQVVSDRKDDRKVAHAIDDFLDREKRRRNLVVHNLPEQAGDTKADRTRADQSFFSKMTRDCFRLETRPVSSFRVGGGTGRDGPNRPRLLVVTLESEDVKHSVLRNASLLKGTEQYSNVYITPDLTYQERQQRRELRAELERRRSQGETNLVIRRGRICVTQTFERQLQTELTANDGRGGRAAGGGPGAARARSVADPVGLGSRDAAGGSRPDQTVISSCPAWEGHGGAGILDQVASLPGSGQCDRAGPASGQVYSETAVKTVETGEVIGGRTLAGEQSAYRPEVRAQDRAGTGNGSLQLSEDVSRARPPTIAGLPGVRSGSRDHDAPLTVHAASDATGGNIGEAFRGGVDTVDRSGGEFSSQQSDGEQRGEGRVQHPMQHPA